MSGDIGVHYSCVCAVLSQSQAEYRCCHRRCVSSTHCSRMDTSCTCTATPGSADPPRPCAAGSSTWWAGIWGRCSTSSWPKGRLCTLMKKHWSGQKMIFFRNLGRFVLPYIVCRWPICLPTLPMSLGTWFPKVTSLEWPRNNDSTRTEKTGPLAFPTAHLLTSGAALLLCFGWTVFS